MLEVSPANLISRSGAWPVPLVMSCLQARGGAVGEGGDGEHDGDAEHADEQPQQVGGAVHPGGEQRLVRPATWSARGSVGRCGRVGAGPCGSGRRRRVRRWSRAGSRVRRAGPPCRRARRPVPLGPSGCAGSSGRFRAPVSGRRRRVVRPPDGAARPPAGGSAGAAGRRTASASPVAQAVGPGAAPAAVGRAVPEAAPGLLRALCRSVSS